MAKSVVVYSAKTNEGLCKIEAPQKWWSGLPLPIPFITVSYHTEWKDPEMIKRWAWQQAYIVTAQLNEIGITKGGDLIPPTFTCRCLACNQDTVKAWARHWFWSSKFTLSGFACSNKECNMYKVIIPLVLCSRIDEMPPEYMPIQDNLELNKNKGNDN